MEIGRYIGRYTKQKIELVKQIGFCFNLSCIVKIINSNKKKNEEKNLSVSVILTGEIE